MHNNYYESEWNNSLSKEINKGKKDKKEDVFQTRYGEKGLNNKYTFENFLVGGSNRFAYDASITIALSPGKYFNPFFICGGEYRDREHLIHAIGNYILKRNPTINVACISSERFKTGLVDSIINDKSEIFREYFNNFDLLMIEDIQFLSDMYRTQFEIICISDSYNKSKKQIIITSDRIPKDLINFDSRLISRLERGLIADIQKPNFDIIVDMLQKIMEELRLTISDDAIEYIAGKISTNIHQIVGILTKLNANTALTNQKEIDLTLAQQIVKDFLATCKNR